MKDTQNDSKTLLDKVLDQLAEDICVGADYTAIEEMLKHLPENVLQAYLPQKES